MPSAALPPLFANTENDHGARPVVLGYIGAAITILVTLIRLGLTFNRSHGFKTDDYAFVAGAVRMHLKAILLLVLTPGQGLAVVASITLERAADEGLGRHANTLSGDQLDKFVRFSYATALLGVFAQSCAKLSVAFLYDRLVPRQDKRGIQLLMGVISAWIVFAVFGTALQCGATVSWARQCATQGYLLYPIVATNLLTDGLLGFWMLPRIWNLQASLEDRVLPCMLMGSRLLVCVLQAGWIIYEAVEQPFSPIIGTDRTWTLTTSWIISISVTHLSVITATIPQINSFIADMQTRRAGIALTQRDYESYKQSKSGSKNDSRNRSQNRSGKWSRSKSPEPTGVMDSLRPDRSNVIRNEFSHGKGPIDEIELDNRDQVETGSQSSLRGNAVYWKTEFRWEEEYNTAQDGTAGPASARGMQRY